jgi:hypothetical protein
MSARWALTFGVLVCIACGSKSTTPSRVAKAGVPVVETDRFPHKAHTGDNPQIRNWQGRGLFCADCHDAAAVVAGNVSRPGTNQHAPCDDCHKAEFEKPPGPMCKICHSSVDPTTLDKAASPLQPYPDRGITAVLASSFSHRLHLDADKMEGATGAHVGCGDCHARAGGENPLPIGHKACARCHEQVPRVKQKLPMNKCAGCHVQRDVDLKRGRRFIIGDLRFAHATHEKDRAGEAVSCTQCHTNVADSSNRDDMAVPAMERCATCHEDTQKSPDRVRMGNCGVCHGEIQSGSPPMNHGVTGAKPVDHTLLFRKNHGEAAAAKDANCRFCHTELHGKPEDSCFQCHQYQKPRDHDIIFRDDHGRAAEAESTRCAACHQPETCAACHSIPPRSHTPIAEFRLGGHAQLARFNLTSCLACHTYQDTCALCHRSVR